MEYTEQQRLYIKQWNYGHPDNQFRSLSEVKQRRVLAGKFYNEDKTPLEKGFNNAGPRVAIIVVIAAITGLILFKIL